MGVPVRGRLPAARIEGPPLHRFFSSRGRHTISKRDWSSDVCSSDLSPADPAVPSISAAGITVGALLAEEMLGTAGSAGLPVGLFTLGSALAAYLVGRITQHRGRRVGLGLGFAAGGLGAAGVIVAAVTGNVVMLCVSFFVSGSGTATNLTTRFAGTDLA